MHPKKRGQHRDHDTYVCASCGETIETALDRSSGEEQEYVEDCPVCCRPWTVHAVEDEPGDGRVLAPGEQDERQQSARPVSQSLESPHRRQD